MGAAKGRNKNAIPLRALTMVFGLKNSTNRFLEQIYVKTKRPEILTKEKVFYVKKTRQPLWVIYKFLQQLK